MLNNNHHNSSCAFAEQIVSYLYNETNAKEKAAFDVHLNSCSNCAEELAGFDFVRSPIVEWKNAEFDNLETPAINIPYPTTISTEKQSWLGDLRRFFTLSPTWATAFATVIVCVGVAFLVFNFSNTTEVAEKENKPINTVVSPIVEKSVELQTEETEKETVKQEKPQPSIVENDSPKIAQQIAPKDQIVKVSNNAKKDKNIVQNTNVAANVRKIKDDKTTAGVKKQTVPKLNSLEEEEDNSLRLADLFAEVESK